MDNILLIKNALSDKHLELCLQEVESNRKLATPSELDDVNFSTRWYPPAKSLIPNIIEELLWSDKVKKEIIPLKDLAWKWFLSGRAAAFEVQVTFYLKNNFYSWHTDHETGVNRILNYILYISEVEGGVLQIANDYEGEDKEYNIDLEVKPEVNKLVIIPSWMKHRVVPVISGERMTINGHVGI